jgi:HemY protein
MPVSPVSGRLDAFQWKVPLAELGEPRDTIEDLESIPERPPVAVAPPAPAAAELPQPSETAAAPAAPKPPAVASGSAATPPRVEPVMPLLHVPDDPGPEAAPDVEPEPSGSRGLHLYK